jgi:hypothetical protein
MSEVVDFPFTYMQKEAKALMSGIITPHAVGYISFLVHFKNV